MFFSEKLRKLCASVKVIYVKYVQSQFKVLSIMCIDEISHTLKHFNAVSVKTNIKLRNRSMGKKVISKR